jgi:hypothetical protein
MLAGCASASLVAVLMLALAVASSASASLPDNRAYEMVSPIEKGGISFDANLAVTDAGGEHVIVDGGSKNAQLSSDMSWMLETRTPTGWSGVQIGPSPTPGAYYGEQVPVSLNAVAEDFSSFAFQTVMPLDPRATSHGMEEYVRNGPTGPFTWASGPPAPAVPVSEPTECNNGDAPVFCATDRAVFAGASANLQDIVWGEDHPLLAPPAALPGYPADTHAHGYEVYESVGGVDQFVGLVPAGSETECGPSHGSCVVPPCGAAMGNQDGGGPFNSFAPVQGAVSGDGSQVIFTSPDPSTGGEGCPPPELDLREGGSRTVAVSASRKAGGDPSGPKEKVYAGSAEEGGRVNTVFFTSKEALTESANTGSADEGIDLYAYTLPAGTQPGRLVDLTPENNTPTPDQPPPPSEPWEPTIPGKVEIAFLGSSTNGALVYFTATSALTPEANSHGQTAKPGVSNLYVYDASTEHTTFIASGHIGLNADERVSARLTSEATPDGRHLVFVSSERLTSYNNFGPECTGGESDGEAQRGPASCVEVYLYTAATGDLVCVSCNPSGAPPVGSARLPERFHEAMSGGGLGTGTLPPPRAISDDGSRVFFSSPDQLTAGAPPPATTKGSQVPMAIDWEFEPNVFEYEGGGVHLIAPAAVLLTSTPSGRDVFFDTLSQLTPLDSDGSPDVYDARVAGGFPVLAPPVCSGSACQGNPAPAPIFATPAGVTFSGVGNFPPPPAAKPVPKSKPKSKPAKCKKNKVRKRSRCVKRSKSTKSNHRKGSK